MLCSRYMNSAVLSQIRIVDTDSVCPFEWTEPERDRSLERPNLVRDPFPVTPLDDGDYLLLADTGLFSRLAGHGLPHIPVQVYPEERVSVTSERLALIGFGYDDLINVVAKHPDQIIISRPDESPPTGFFPVGFEFGDELTITVYLRHSSRIGCAGSLDSLFRAIHSHGRYFPAFESRHPNHAIVKSALPTAHISLPAFSLKDLQAAATSDRLFPPELIRPRTVYRVINIDFPVDVLADDISREEKDAFLRELIVFREQSRRTSFFEGQVYILNR